MQHAAMQHGIPHRAGRPVRGERGARPPGATKIADMRRFFLLLLLAACATAQIDLPSDSFTVEGANPRRWNQPLYFGEWRTSTVNEGATRSFLADLDIVQIGKADQGYRMTLGDTFVECHTREVVIGRAGFFVDVNLGREPLLVCGLDDAGSRSVLALSRTGKIEPALRGELRGVAGGPSLEVRSIQRVSGSAIPSGEPFGYELLSDGRRVAAVETINRGRVWIDPNASNRDTLAAAAAALLLFRDPDAGTVD